MKDTTAIAYAYTFLGKGVFLSEVERFVEPLLHVDPTAETLPAPSSSEDEPVTERFHTLPCAPAVRPVAPLAFDFETHLIRPGCLAPPPVCLTWQRPGQEARICVGEEMAVRFRDWLSDPATLLIGANVAFDMAVAAEAWPHLRPAIFAAYDADPQTESSAPATERLLTLPCAV